MGVGDDILLKGELLKRVKLNTWIPKSREEEFGEAILKAFKEFLAG